MTNKHRIIYKMYHNVKQKTDFLNKKNTSKEIRLFK